MQRSGRWVELQLPAMEYLRPMAHYALRAGLAGMVLLGGLAGNSIAQVTWQRAYGGQGMQEGHGIRQVADGGFIVVGSTGSAGQGPGEVYLLKLDSMGLREWSQAYAGAGVRQGWAVRQMPDEGYVVAGFEDAGEGRGYDGLLMRMDATGHLMWQRNIGTPDWDFFYDLEVAEDGFVLAGATYGSGVGAQAWVVRTGWTGDVMWEQYIGTGEGTEARCLRRTVDGGLVVAGSLAVGGGLRNAFVAKLAANGPLDWLTPIPEPGGNAGYSVVETGDGGYALGGYTVLPDRRVMLLAKADAGGALQWINHVEGGTGNWEGRSIRVDHGGGLVLSGITTSYGNGAEDFYMARTDALGNWVSGPSFGTFAMDQCWDMDMTADGGYVMAGTTWGAGINISSVYVVKNAGGIIPQPLVAELDPLVVQAVGGGSGIHAFPNPAHPGGVLHIDLAVQGQGYWTATLYDSSGRQVAGAPFGGQRPGLLLLPIALRPGLYELRVKTQAGAAWSTALAIMQE